MKAKILFISLFVLGLFLYNPVSAEKEKRDVSSFSEISLRISAKVYLVQGNKQSVEVEAKSSVLDNIVTEVKGRSLIIRFKKKNYFLKQEESGKIEIYITVPEIDKLAVSGSGDILSEKIESRILNLAVSGSGDIVIDNLDAERIKTSVSGSGDIAIKDGGVAEEFSASIAGSGDIRAIGFEADDVVINIAGSGNCSITSNGSIKARLAGSGNVNFKGSASVDSSVAGSGRVKRM